MTSVSFPSSAFFSSSASVCSGKKNWATLLHFLSLVLTSCVWLMFLLVSYWLWSDAPITEVTEVHYVTPPPPPSASLPRSHSLSTLAWQQQLSQFFFFPLKCLETKSDLVLLLSSGTKINFSFQKLYTRNKSRPPPPPLPPPPFLQFKFVPPHIHTHMIPMHKFQIICMSVNVPPWMDQGGMWE